MHRGYKYRERERKTTTRTTTKFLHNFYDLHINKTKKIFLQATQVIK